MSSASLSNNNNSINKTKTQDITKVLVKDGAMGTMLEYLGINFDSNTPMWSSSILISNQNLIQNVHQSYINAGCDILLTCTYQISEEGCRNSGVNIKELVQCAIKTALSTIPSSSSSLLHRVILPKERKKKEKNIINTENVFNPFLKMFKEEKEENNNNNNNNNNSTRTILLAGSLGPYGSYLPGGSEYRGDYEVHESLIKSFHANRILAFVENSNEESYLNIDFFLFETFPRYDEAIEILKWLQQHNTLYVAPVCFSFVATPVSLSLYNSNNNDNLTLDTWWENAENALYLPDGHTFEETFYKLRKYQFKQLIGIGCNCSGPLEIALISSLMLRKKREKSEPALALLLYSNSGETYKNGIWYKSRETEEKEENNNNNNTTPLLEKYTLQELKKILAQGEGNVQICTAFFLLLWKERPFANDWLFEVIICGACCRSMPEDISAIKAMI